MSRIEFATEKITPAKAAEYLKNNDTNRTLSNPTVLFYASQMERGEWKLTHEGIAFDHNGHLLDGQHRLHAIIKSGCTVEMMAIKNVDRAVFPYLNYGKMRKGQDVLHIAGYKDSNNLSAVVTWVMRYRQGKTTAAVNRNQTKISNMDILRFVEKNPEIIECAKIGISYGKRSGNLVAKSLVGALYYLMSRKNPEMAPKFFNCLFLGEDLGNNEGIRLLRERLAKNNIAMVKFNKRVISALIILAWNKFQEGQAFKILRFSQEYAFPEIL